MCFQSKLTYFAHGITYEVYKGEIKMSPRFLPKKRIELEE